MASWNGRVATLGEIHNPPRWGWVICNRPCGHRSPLGLAAAIIRWGPAASSNVLRERARCTRCGHLGATIQGPGWGGMNSDGPAAFPNDVVLP
jgi:hypothetical protein